MRPRMALALALLLTPSMSWGGAASKLRGVMNSKPPVITANAIGGVTSISSSGATDTGTGAGSGTGTISVFATCSIVDTGSAFVRLVVNGSVASELACISGGDDLTSTLTATVSGNYTARVYGTATGDGYFSTTSFGFPVTP